MKNILVPTDFSNLSTYALEFAVQLAAPLEARVTVLHLEEVPLGDVSLHLSGEASNGSPSDDTLFNIQLFRSNKNKLKQIEHDFSTDEVLVTSRQYGGGFLNGMKKYVEQHATDLIVIGTTGQESIQEFFSGNHTEQLIEHLSVPVLSLQSEQFHEVEDIVLGLDLQDEKYTQKAFSMVKIISEALDARLHIVSIVKSNPTDDLLNKLNKIAKIVGLSNYMVDVIEDRNEREALMDYADGTGAGLIITLSEAKSGLNRFFQHSFATNMTKKSNIPVLTINKGNLN